MNRKKSLFTFFEQRIKKVLILTLAIGSFAFVGSANAALLDLTLKATPDISVGSISVEYNGSEFTATGSTQIYQGVSGATTFLTGGVFNLTANIDAAGMLTPLGSDFTITNSSGDTLLVGALTAFGFGDVAGGTKSQFEFEYAATSGTLSSAFSGIGGIIMSGNTVGLSASLFNNSFGPSAADFTANVGKIPEPLSVFLFGAGLLALGVRQRRSKTI